MAYLTVISGNKILNENYSYKKGQLYMSVDVDTVK